MRVTWMLADYVTVADAKFVIVGGGWSVTGPGPSQFAIALKVDVPWDQRNVKHEFRIELVDADHVPVTFTADDGEEKQLSIDGEFETASNVGVKPGTDLPVLVPINLPPQAIPPGRQYEWRLSINGETQPDWSLRFTTRPAPAAQALG